MKVVFVINGGMKVWRSFHQMMVISTLYITLKCSNQKQSLRILIGLLVVMFVFCVEQRASGSSYLPPARTRDVVVNSKPLKLKYCFTCKMFRPPRTSHCSMCNVCVGKKSMTVYFTV